MICRNLDRAHETQAKYYNAKKRDRNFRVGDLILRPNRKLSKKVALAGKLFQIFEGPFKIKRRLSPVVFTLVDKKGRFIGKEHIKNLKPFIAPE